MQKVKELTHDLVCKKKRLEISEISSLPRINKIYSRQNSFFWTNSTNIYTSRKKKLSIPICFPSWSGDLSLMALTKEEGKYFGNFFFGGWKDQQNLLKQVQEDIVSKIQLWVIVPRVFTNLTCSLGFLSASFIVHTHNYWGKFFPAALDKFAQEALLQSASFAGKQRIR